MGILAFLLHWSALSQLPYIGKVSNQDRHNHWGLLKDFSAISESDLELYIPQICNILSSGKDYYCDEVLERFEDILAKKCEDCLPFGIKLSGYLRASCTPFDGLFSQVMLTPQLMAKEEAIKLLQQRIDRATEYGSNSNYNELMKRVTYFNDYNFLISTLTRISAELKQFRVDDRSHHLKSALIQCNELLLQRVMSRGNDASTNSALGSGGDESFKAQGLYDINNHPVPALRQDLSWYPIEKTTTNYADTGDLMKSYSLHYPLQLSSKEPVLRIIRFAESDCEILPSKERCPYLAVVEVIEVPYNGTDSRTYSPFGKFHDNIELYDNKEPQTEKFSGECLEETGSTVVTNRRYKFSRYRAGAANRDLHRKIEDIDKSLSDADPLDLSFDEERKTINQYSNTKTFSDPKQESGSMIVRRRSTPYLSKFQFRKIKSWLQKKEIIKKESRFGSLPGWDLKSFVVKTGVDMKREVLAMQLINLFKSIFESEGLDILLKPYRILCTGNNCGLIEYLEGTSSIDSIKKSSFLRSEIKNHLHDPFQQQNSDIIDIYSHMNSDTNIRDGALHQSPEFSNRLLGDVSAVDALKTRRANTLSGAKEEHCRLKDYFEFKFGPSYSPLYARALNNFVKSLAGYSIATYVLQVKDRHNANILIDELGHVIHIDFGFILGQSPGFNINFENAPFKLTEEYIEVMGGINSPAFHLFQDLFCKGFFALKKHVNILTSVLQLHKDFSSAAALNSFRARLEVPDSYASVNNLIKESLNNWRTKQYDWFQYKTNNILS